MADLSARKDAARQAAFARRKAARAGGDQGRADQDAALASLTTYLDGQSGSVLAGYMAIRTELDPLNVMAGWAGPVCVPVIAGRDQPLVFHRWTPGAEMIDGPFGARVPASAKPIEPDILIVPLLAFSRDGGRLGYGGGFYDRTLEGLRARRAVRAVGLAFAAQEDLNVPLEPTDQPLDAIVTQDGVLTFG